LQAGFTDSTLSILVLDSGSDMEKKRRKRKQTVRLFSSDKSSTGIIEYSMIVQLI